ncbi:decarboxylase [Streptomyces sp. C10-9-1]|uniref:maleate cis-trans isomerase family protein n=1 Tax=Streptomyces sp. C10-9-1 TaxID=1859285 RepID=UPI002110EF10|nr:decarboxylase [Streptomyces sp. C10-9-1]MCQ6553037.1 decarboxylase [Streptomyces sp. C10-9-1]
MTTVGLLYPGHSAEDDYPRIEALLTGVNVPVVHTDIGEDAHRVDALLRMGEEDRLAAGVEELRLSGAESVVWACTSGSFVYGWAGAREQVRSLALAAGLPASSTSFAFVRAAQAVGAARVAVAASYPEDVAELFAQFLGEAGVEVVSAVTGGVATAAEAARWGPGQLLDLVRAADRPEAEAVLVPDTALRTVALLPELEEAVGKPVLTANQVTVWEGLRLAERHGVRADELGALFAGRD